MSNRDNILSDFVIDTVKFHVEIYNRTQTNPKIVYDVSDVTEYNSAIVRYPELANTHTKI